MVKVSIIVPAYNVEKYISRCIESLLKQTLKEVEIILINDGSTDRTDEIIKTFLPNDKIRYFKRSNHGIGNTRNFGLKQANGEYIGFVDSDDYVEHTMFKKMYDKASKGSFDLVVCDFYRDFEETDIRTEDIVTSYIDEPTNLKTNSNLINLVNLSPWNKLYRRDMIDTNIKNFSENLKYEDVPFVIRMLDKAKKIGKVELPLYHYVIHKNSETTVVDKRVFDLFSIFDILREEHYHKEYLRDSLEYLFVQRLSDYNIQQRNQKEKKLQQLFVNKSFEYLKKYVRNYRKSKYYKNISFIKRFIEKNKIVTKIYIKLYRWQHKEE